MRLIILLSGIFIFSACENHENRPVLYFDIPGFITKEITHLKENAFLLNKKLRYQTHTEQQQIGNPQWESELTPFLETDLNKPAYAGRFYTDSLVAGDTLIISYTSNDIKTDIKSVVVYSYRQIPFKLCINLTERNALYNSTKTLEYTHNSLITIKGEQQLRLSKATTYEIEGFITKP